MNNNNNGRVWGIVIGIIVVIIIIVLVVRHKNAGTAMAPNGEATTSDTSALSPDGSTPTEDISAGSVHVTTPAASLAYTDALALYKGKRIQFTDTCQATPINETFANNVDLMLDNRSATTRSLHLGFLGDITIKPWGFKIVNFSSATLPRAVVIDCGVSQNVAEVTLQK